MLENSLGFARYDMIVKSGNIECTYFRIFLGFALSFIYKKCIQLKLLAYLVPQIAQLARSQPWKLERYAKSVLS